MAPTRIAPFRKLAVALAVVVAAACAASRLSDAGASPKLSGSFPHALRIVAFGSSSTQGVGASSPGAAYPAQLEQLLRASMPDGDRVQVVNRGIGGEDVDDMMGRLGHDVVAARPDIAIWQTGSNDALRHVPLERFERETRAGIAAIRRAGITIVLMEPKWSPKLEATGTVDEFRDAVRRIGTEMGVTVIRRSDLMHDWIRSGVMTMAEMLSPDGLHMRDAGYRLLAVHVAAEVLHMEAARAHPFKTAGL